MPRRVKDEERIEMIIRGLLKQPDNRRCINCNSLGPQYVCTTFWTFVCTSCSGVHREFSHRVKSVSMAKFNEDEIMSLQAGGNERAKQIYFKTWDPQRNSYPESGNLQKIRELVNHVYIDRRYCGENNKLAMVTMDSRRNSCDWPAKSRWGRKDNFLGRSSFERAGNSDLLEKATPSSNKVLNLQDFLEVRSPRTPQENVRSNSLRSAPTRFEIVDDRFREDGRVKTYERQSRKESGGGSMSPRSRTTSLPAICPVKAILGDKVPELRIEGPPKAEGLAIVEKVADAGGNAKRNNAVNSSSLIDFFDAEPEPVSSNTNDESYSVASSSNQAVSDVPNMNPMDSLLLEWSSPVASPSAGISNSLGTGNNNTTVQEIQMHQLPQTQAFVSPPGNSNTSSSTQQSAASVESSSNQHWNNSLPSNDLRPIQSVPLEQSSQGVNPGEVSAYSARKEIPEDLFTSHFTPFTPAAAGWHMQPHHGAVYGMQYHHPAMSAAAFPEPQKPRNPFDVGDDRYQDQGAIFPSMSSLQGALPNMPTSIPLESQSSPYAAAPDSHPQVSPYGMNMSLVPGAYMGQMTTNMPPTSNFDRREVAFASLNPIQQTSGPDSLLTSPLPRVGNPFG
ncbi:hypothetical protein ACS0TY_012339 [Phlomoides rotata]